jgi:hypothetical protein
MRRVVLLIAFFFVSAQFVVLAQKDSTIAFGEEKIETEYYFGFNLIENISGGMVHLAIIKPGDYRSRRVKLLTKDGFIAQASGKQQSLANPQKVNFFEKFEIKNPNIIDDLWRLRYKEYPYFTSEKMEPGWSTNDSIPFLPTEAQMQILNKFGLERMSDYIMGDDAFKLLKLMEQPEWINSYKESY